MVKRICNMCGKDFDRLDERGNLGFHYKVGYGSVYDGEDINLDLCCDCFDELIEYIVTKCKINPIENID